MNNRGYKVLPANPKQLEGIAALFKLNEKKKQENVIIFIAEDACGTPVGRIVIIERSIPSPLNGKRWYVYDLFVSSAHRRKGIATALVLKTMEEAEKACVIFIYGSANASVEASYFWLKQGFSMNAYGRKQDDPAMPLFYGNYFHMFSHCIRRKPLLDRQRNDSVKALSNEKTQRLIDEYMTDSEKKVYYMSKGDTLSGFAICGKHGEIMGAIIAFPDSMQAPLESIRLFVDVFVMEEYRKKGVGRELICEVCHFAKEIGAIQLTNFSQTAEYIGFWYEIGFDVFFWDVNPNTGEYSTTAMLRIE